MITKSRKKAVDAMTAEQLKARYEVVSQLGDAASYNEAVYIGLVLEDIDE